MSLTPGLWAGLLILYIVRPFTPIAAVIRRVPPQTLFVAALGRPSWTFGERKSRCPPKFSTLLKARKSAASDDDDDEEDSEDYSGKQEDDFEMLRSQVLDRVDPAIRKIAESYSPEGNLEWIDKLTDKDLRTGLRSRWAPMMESTRLARMCGQPAPHAVPTLQALQKEEHEGYFDQAKNDILDFIETERRTTQIDKEHFASLRQFIEYYIHAAEKSNALSPERMKQLTTDLIKFVSRNEEFSFEPYHQAVREPYDFYRLGIDFFQPLVDLTNSKVEGENELAQIERQLEQGDNVIFLSNHQIEPDPQIIGIILNSMGFHNLAEKMTMLAGHRVRSDPLTAPLSRGRNLICIHSKRHIEEEKKEQRQKENLEAMNAMQNLLKQGGQLLWVAPSGGRDRPDKSGTFKVSDFDPKTVSLFNIIAKKSKRLLHFYPMALFTYPICPPPPDIKKELGEARTCAFSPVGMAIGREVAVADDMTDIAQKYVKKAYDSINPAKKRRRTFS